MDLLGPESLVRTSTVDHADWNYSGLLGSIQRSRFRLLLSLLRGHSFTRILEIGYGSGVFMPALSLMCESLYGLDPHLEDRTVEEILRRNGIQATLVRASAEDMPFPDSHFGCVVAVSAMEYIDEIECACAEIHRVLEPGGVLAIVTPAHSLVVDLAHRILTGESAENHYQGKRKRLVRSLQDEFQLDARQRVRILGFGPILYHGLRLRRREA